MLQYDVIISHVLQTIPIISSTVRRLVPIEERNYDVLRRMQICLDHGLVLETVMVDPQIF